MRGGTEMSLSCQYEQVNLINYFGDIVRQVSLEAKLRLPEHYPKLAKVKGGYFQTEAPQLVVDEGVLTVNGRISPHLVYLAIQSESSDEAGRESVNGSLPVEYGISWGGESRIGFTEQLEIPGLNPDTVVEVDFRPNAVLYERETQDEVAFRGVIDLIAHTAAPQNLEFVSEISTQPPGRVKVNREAILVEEFTGLATAVIPVRQVLLLPQFKPGISRIVDYTVRPAGISIESYNGKIAVKGWLEVAALYVGADEAGQPTEIFVNEWNRELETALPFETFIDHDTTGRMVIEPKITVKNLAFTQKSPRELSCQLDLDCELKIMEIKVKEPVVEAVPETGELIDIEKHLINLEEFKEEYQGVIPFEAGVELPVAAPEVERLLTYQGLLTDVTVEAGEEQLLLKGNLNLSLYYITSAAADQCLYQANWGKGGGNGLTVTGRLDCPGLPSGAVFRSRVTLDALQVELIGARTLKVQGRIKPQIVVKQPRALSVIGNCALVTPVDPATRPSMLFYIVQPEDTLWKIARKYQTTVRALAQVNQLPQAERLEVGQKLLIPKRMMTGS
jgi:hypothetical protein